MIIVLVRFGGPHSMIFVICLLLYGESFNGWGGGCRKFVKVWGINDQSPGGMT